MTTNAYEMLTHGVQDFAQPHPECKRDVLGERWTVCHAPGDGPCYCDVVVKAGPPSADDDTRESHPRGWCYVCGGASWLAVRSGFLCQTHFDAMNGDPPIDIPEEPWPPTPEGPPPPNNAFPRAVSLQSIAIDSRIKRCKCCDGPHFTWACPDIGDARLPAVYDTTEIWHLWGISRTLLAAKLARLTAPQLLCQAIDFAAWLNDQTRANLPAEAVLRIWQQFIADGGDRGLALERVA